MSSAITIEATASAASQPVAVMTMAATMTAADADEVAENLEVGAPHVEALPLGLAKEPQRQTVAGESHERDREHEPGLHLGRIGKPPPGLEEDERRHPEQEDRIGDRREDPSRR